MTKQPQPTQPRQITVTIVRTFTPDDDPFGLFGLLTEAGSLDSAASELRYDTLYVESDERQLIAVDNLLDGAEWKVEHHPCLT